MWRRIVTAAFLTATCVAGASAQIPTYLAPGPLHDPSIVDADQLAGEVTIYRDAYGLPHIVGETDEAMYFGFGYASAEDHIERILTNYRRGAGRMAEIAGERYILSDYHARLFRLRQMAIDRENEIDPELRAVLDAYAAGINHFMDENPSKTPKNAERVVPADIVGFHRYVTLFEFVLARHGVFGPARPLPTGVLLGLSPARSDERMPTLLATFQAEWAGPLGLYEAHLSSGEGLDVYGATFPGLPAIFIGCNSDIAWGFTPNSPDLADTYLLTMNSFSPPLYQYMNGTYQMWIESTQIGVKEPGGDTRTVPKLMPYAHNGPVVDTSGMTSRVIRAAGWHDLNGLRQWLLVNRAGSTGDFKRALSAMQVPSLNAVCVDRKGNTFFAYCAKGQYKLETVNWRQPVDGGRMDTEWRGFIPFTDLPQVTNPDSGFVQSANGLPWRASAESSPAATGGYPRYLVEDKASIRSDRLLDVLETETELSLAQVKELSWDVTVSFVEPALQMLAAAQQTGWRKFEDPRGQMLNSIQVLQQWDRRADSDSRGAVLFDAWWRQYRASFKDNTEAEIIERMKKPGSRESQAGLAALRMAVDIVIARYGQVDVTWSAVRRMRRGLEDYPAQGAARLHTIHQTDPQTDAYKRIAVAGRGDAYKMIVQLGDTPQIHSIVPWGNSSAPRSKHATDQMKLYSEKGYKEVNFTNSLKGGGMVSAWGTKARLEISPIDATLDFQAGSPVSVKIKSLDTSDIAPPMPKTARLVAAPVRLAALPTATRTEWTFTIEVPDDLKTLLDEGYVPVCLTEPVPSRWRPLAARLKPDKSGIVVQGSGSGTIAVYLVIEQNQEN
jgi:acyl-homoserine-lactone acylase